jgi:hypothetical protein
VPNDCLHSLPISSSPSCTSTCNIRNWLIDWLIDHFYSAHINSIECSWRLADVLACSQKVSHMQTLL